MAGGWAVLTIRDLPDYVTAGEPIELTVAVRQHGQRLASGVPLVVTASDGRHDVKGEVSATKEVGYYLGAIVLPTPGDWTLAVESRGPHASLHIPVTAMSRGARPPVVSAAERGRRLFVAKGCVACHRHDAISSRDRHLGPPLVSSYPPELVRWRLVSRASDTTRSEEASAPESWRWPMPHLELTPKEIDALVAFLSPELKVADR